MKKILMILFVVGVVYFPAVSIVEVSAQAAQDFTVITKIGAAENG